MAGVLEQMAQRQLAISQMTAIPLCDSNSMIQQKKFMLMSFMKLTVIITYEEASQNEDRTSFSTQVKESTLLEQRVARGEEREWPARRRTGGITWRSRSGAGEPH